MTIRTFWVIFFKILGIWLVVDCIFVIPGFFSTLLSINSMGMTQGYALTSVLLLLTIAVYIFILRLFLFKPAWLIDKLKLDQGFDQTEFSFNISTSSVLTIALIVIGGVILINEIPNLCRQLFFYVQEKRVTSGMAKPDFSYSIISAVKIVIGLLLIGERKRIVGWFEKR